jgi:hypothetical protein
MDQRALFTVSLAAVLQLASGCGSSTITEGTGGATTGSGTGGSGPSAAEACADAAKAACAQRDTCSMNGFLNDAAFGSTATCEARSALACPSSLMAKGTAQTPAHLEECVAAYAGYACADFFDNDPPSACTPPAGTQANGAPCGASAQCASTFCATGPFAVCGTCAALPAAGAPCLVQADCGRDLACAKPQGSTPQTPGTCAAWVPMGGECLAGQSPCAAGLVCVGEEVASSTKGKCQPAASAIGAACDLTRKTMASCDANLGLFCVPASATSKGVGTCQPIKLAAPGEPCGVLGAAPVTGFASCKDGGLCKKASPGDNAGTCVAAAADGMPCDSDVTKGPPCMSPAKCVPASGAPMGTTSGTCVVPDATKCM